MSRMDLEENRARVEAERQLVLGGATPGEAYMALRETGGDPVAAAAYVQSARAAAAAQVAQTQAAAAARAANQGGNGVTP